MGKRQTQQAGSSQRSRSVSVCAHFQHFIAILPTARTSSVKNALRTPDGAGDIGVISDNHSSHQQPSAFVALLLWF